MISSYLICNVCDSKTVEKQVCLNQVVLLLQKVRNQLLNIILKYEKNRGKWIDDTIINCVCVCVCALSHFSHVRLFATPWTIAHQVSLSMGFSRQEYWSELPCPTTRNLSDAGMKSTSPSLQVDSLPLNHWGNPYI